MPIRFKGGWVLMGCPRFLQREITFVTFVLLPCEESAFLGNNLLLHVRE